MSIKLRALSVSLMLAGCISLPVSAVQSDQSSEMLMRGAKKWIAKERPDLARNMLKKLILIEPASEEALFMLGNIELRMGKPEEALRYLRALEQSAPNSSRTRELGDAYRLATTDKASLEKARSLAREGKHEEAEKMLLEVFHGTVPKGEMALEYYRIVGMSKAGHTRAQDELAALYRETGDTRYRLLQLELQANRPEYVESAIHGYEALAGSPNVHRKSLRHGWLQGLYKLGSDDKKLDAVKLFLAVYPGDREATELLDDVQKNIASRAQFAQQPAVVGQPLPPIAKLAVLQPGKEGKQPKIVEESQPKQADKPKVVEESQSKKTDKPKVVEEPRPRKVAVKPQPEKAPQEPEEVLPEEEDPDIVARTEALDALQDGKLEEAESALLDLLNRRPQDPEVLGGLGIVRLKQGRHAEASVRFEQALQAAQAAKGETARWESLIEAANFWKGLRAAEALLEEKRLAEAEETIQQALALKPGNPNGLAVLGKIKAAAGDDAGAESAYREALKAEGYNVSALVGLVDLLSRTERKEEALALLEQVLQDYPLEWKKNPDSQARLLREEANLYAAMNRPGQAIKALEQGVIADPKNPWVRFSLSKLYISLDMAPLGKRVVQEGVALDPENAEMRYVQALVLLSLDDHAGALDTLNRIPEGELTGAMRDARSRALIQYAVRQAESKLAQGDRKEAIRIMSVAETQSEGSYPATEQVADGWFRLGLPAQGLRAMRKLPRPMPLETQVHYASLLNRAKEDRELVEFLPSLPIPQGEDEDSRRYRETIRDIEFSMAGRQFDKLMKAGKTEQAQQLADSVLGANQLSNAEYFRARRSYFYKAELPVNAIPSLIEAKEQAPDDRDMRWELANAYHQAKQNDNAQKELRELLVMTPPDDIDGRIRIAKLQQSTGDVSGARQTVNDLVARYPGNVDVLFQAGNLAQAGGRYNEAMDYYEQTREQARKGTPAKAVAAVAQQEEDSGILLDLLPARTLQMPAGAGNAGQAAPKLPSTPESMRIYRTALASDAAQPKQAPAGSTVASQAELEMAAIEARRTAKIETGLDVQAKQATNGTSTYNATEVPVLVSFPIGYEAQGMVQVDKVDIDAGALPSTLADASSFGTIKAYQVLPPQPLTPASSGVSVGFGYEQGSVKADLGKAGIGFPVSNVVGGIRTGGSIGKIDYSLNLSRRPYTGSQLSYAGMRDPVTGAVWGGVTNTGLSLWAGTELGSFNVSGVAAYGLLRGKNVLDNDRLFLRAVVDKDVYESGNTTLNVGVNANYTRFAKNQAYYTFGHGGYYSPQSSLSFGVPVELSGYEDMLSYRIRASISYSRTQEDAALYYPTDPVLQALAGGATYAGGNGGGFGFGLLAAAEYRLSPELVLGGRFSMDRSAYYAPNSLLIYLRYLFKPETGPVRKPEPLVPYAQY